MLQLGVRAEKTKAKAYDESIDDVETAFERDYLNFFPSVFTQRTFSENYQMSFSYRRQIARPNYKDMLPYDVYFDRYTIFQGNLQLQPQFSHVASLTHTIKDVNISLDYEFVEDLIRPLPLQDGSTKIIYWAQRNIDQTRSYGGSVFVPITVTSWWQTENSIWGSYKLSKGIIGDDYVELSGFNLALNTSHTITLPSSWKMNIGIFFLPSEVDGFNRQESYNYAWVSAMKDFWKKRMQLKVSLNDIFRGTVYRATQENASLRLDQSAYHDSRRIGFTLTYNFGKKTVDKVDSKDLGNKDAIQRIN